MLGEQQRGQYGLNHCSGVSRCQIIKGLVENNKSLAFTLRYRNPLEVFGHTCKMIYILKDLEAETGKDFIRTIKKEMREA